MTNGDRKQKEDVFLPAKKELCLEECWHVQRPIAMNNRYKQRCRAIKLVSASYEQWLKMYEEHIVFERRHWKMEDS